MTLPKDTQLWHLDGKRYALEYAKYGFEPTIGDFEKTAAMLHKVFAKIANQIKAGPVDKARAYIRDENVTIGLIFKSTLGFNDMSKINPGMGSRDDDDY